MILRAILPGLSLICWGFFAYLMAGEDFSSPEQARYYFWFPLLMTGVSLTLILAGSVKRATIVVQFLAALMLIPLFPYLLFYTGGM